MVDVVVLTDPRYAAPKKRSAYIDNVLLEDRLVQEALERQGLKTTRKSWDDPDFDWTSTKLALFRSTWDYFDRYGEFSQWFERTSKKTSFINSRQLVQWNMDKHYLLDLQRGGIHIPRTVFVEKGTETSLGDACAKAVNEQGFRKGDFVLKPCVSGGARHTYRFGESEIAGLEAVFKELVSQQAMMVQEFQQWIVEQGEFSLMVFDGGYSHAVLKKAKPGDFRVQDDHGGSVHVHAPDREQIEFAESVVAAAPELPLYARVDIFRDNEGLWALAELEIIEPELWFRLNPPAADVLARAIKKRKLG